MVSSEASSEASSERSSESSRKPLNQAKPLFKAESLPPSLADISEEPPATSGGVELSSEVPGEEPALPEGIAEPELLVALASSAASALGKSPEAVEWARSEETASFSSAVELVWMVSQAPAPCVGGSSRGAMVGAAVAAATRKRKKGATVLMIKECVVGELEVVRTILVRTTESSVAAKSYRGEREKEVLLYTRAPTHLIGDTSPERIIERPALLEVGDDVFPATLSPDAKQHMPYEDSTDH